jgi:hypothetical protein
LPFPATSQLSNSPRWIHCLTPTTSSSPCSRTVSLSVRDSWRTTPQRRRVSPRFDREAGRGSWARWEGGRRRALDIYQWRHGGEAGTGSCSVDAFSPRPAHPGLDETHVGQSRFMPAEAASEALPDHWLAVYTVHCAIMGRRKLLERPPDLAHTNSVCFASSCDLTIASV